MARYRPPATRQSEPAEAEWDMRKLSPQFLHGSVHHSAEEIGSLRVDPKVIQSDIDVSKREFRQLGSIADSLASLNENPEPRSSIDDAQDLFDFARFADHGKEDLVGARFNGGF